MATPFNSIEDAIKDIKKGKFIILVDDEDRENEGDLVMAASSPWRCIRSGWKSSN